MVIMVVMIVEIKLAMVVVMVKSLLTDNDGTSDGELK